MMISALARASTASFYCRPQYRGRQDQAPRSHNSQDSIRDALEVVSYSFLQLLKRPCRMHLLRNGLSLQIRRERPEDRAFLSVFVGIDLNDRWSCDSPANRTPPWKFP